MSEQITEVVARALWSSQSSIPWEQGVTGAYQAAYRRLAQAAIQAHTAALVEGAGELCERLNACAEDYWGELACEAAATIAALTAELARVKEALEPFAKCCEQIADDEDDEEWAKFRLLIKDYRRAARALDPAAIALRDAALSDLIAGDADMIDAAASTLADSDGDDGA